MDIGQTIISLVGGGIGGQVIMRIASVIWPTKTEEIDVDALIQKSLENHVNFLQGQINNVRDENIQLRKDHTSETAQLRAEHTECETRCSTMAVEIRKLKIDMTEVKINASNQQP